MAARTVVITGSTRGIGLGLADAFLDLGFGVMISGRSESAVEEALAGLAARHPGAPAAGAACDVADYDQVRSLLARAEERLGPVDVWINNAGTCTSQLAFSRLDPEALRSVITTNLLGAVNGSRVALEAMEARGAGQIFNMEGFGADGERKLGMATYGATKAALRYLTASLVDETRRGPVKIGTLSPGVVITDLLVDSYATGDADDLRRARWLFKFIADPASIVCPYLARAVAENRRTGVRIAWMTIPKAIGRFFLPSYHRRDLLAGLLPARP